MVTEKIAFSDLSLGIFPPGIRLDNLKNFKIKDENILSFKKVSLEFPFQSPFNKKLKVNVYIHRPMIQFTDSLLKKGKEGGDALDLPFEVNQVNILNGEFHFTAKNTQVDLLNFNLNSAKHAREIVYKLNSPHLKIIFPLSGGLVKLEGAFLCEFRPQTTSWKIKSLSWKTEDMAFDINGRVFDNGTIAMNASLKGSPDKILYPALKELSPVGYMETTAQIRRKRKETLFVQGGIECHKFTISNEPFENMAGTVNWDSDSTEIHVDLKFNDGPHTSHLEVFSIPTITRVEGDGMTTEKLFRIIDITEAVPIGSVIKDTKISIEKGIISGKGRLIQDSKTVPNYFNVGGDVIFSYNSHDKSVSFQGENVITEFGRLHSLKGLSAPHQKTSLQFSSSGTISDLGMVDKYTNYYVDLEFQQWKLKGGNGTVSLDLHKTGNDFYLQSDLAIAHFFTGTQPIGLMAGHISTEKNITTASFSINDPKIKGNANLYVAKDFFTIDMKGVQGEFDKMMKILELDIELSGYGEGSIHLLKKNNEKLPLVQCQFSSQQINFYDFIFDDVKGDLENFDYISLKNLSYSYNGGKGNGNVFIDYGKKIYNLKGEINGIDVSRLHPEFQGTGGISFQGEGAFIQDPIRVEYSSDELKFYADRSFKVEGKAQIFTDFDHFRIETGGNLHEGEIVSPYTFMIDNNNDMYTGAYTCTLNDINLLIPWGNNEGIIELKGTIAGPTAAELSSKGQAKMRGKILSFPNFPHALEDYSGTVSFNNLNFTLSDLKGTLGGGKVEGSGILLIQDNQLQKLNVNFKGQKMNIYLIDRTNFNLNADLSLELMPKTRKLLLSGDINVNSGIWEREVTEGVSFNTDPSLSATGSQLMDRLQFNIKMVSRDNIRMNNSMARGSGKFNLVLEGSPEFPILLGYLDCRKGIIYFSDKTFDIIKARIVFNDRFDIDPLINVESESFVKDYRIKFNIKGRSSLIKPELSSSPPLPYRDILTLISLGELFERPTASDLTSRVDSGTTGMIASQLTEQIKKRTRKIFGNYMLKIDPNISNITGASFENSSRLIVGKEISKDFLVVYATNFSENRKQVVYMQYQISPAVSLIGMVDEEGKYSLDLRFRKKGQ